MSASLRPHGLQDAKPPYLSSTPRIYSNSCQLSRWCHPTISSSVFPFFSCPQSFSASGSFQNELVPFIMWPNYWSSASASVLPRNIQDWFSLGWTGWISLQSKGFSRVFFNMGNRWGDSGSSVRLYFFGDAKSLQMVTAAMKLNDTYSSEGKLWPT